MPQTHPLQNFTITRPRIFNTYLGFDLRDLLKYRHSFWSEKKADLCQRKQKLRTAGPPGQLSYRDRKQFRKRNPTNKLHKYCLRHRSLAVGNACVSHMPAILWRTWTFACAHFTQLCHVKLNWCACDNRYVTMRMFSPVSPLYEALWSRAMSLNNYGIHAWTYCGSESGKK